MTIRLYEHWLNSQGHIKSQLLVENYPKTEAMAKALRYFNCPSGQKSVHITTVKILEKEGLL